MNRLMSLFLAFIMCSTLCACSSGNENNSYEPTSTEEDETITYTLVACDYLMEYMKNLKNPYTIEINRVDCYIRPRNIGEYRPHDEVYFTISYSAENNFGGKVTTIIGNHEIGGIELDSDSTYEFIESIYADDWYFVEDETYAKDQADSFTLDPKEIQEYILENY